MYRLGLCDGSRFAKVDDFPLDFLDDIKHTRRFKSQVLKARLNENEVAMFSVNQHKFPGFSIEARLARYYPFGDTLTHALGYVAKLNKKELVRDKGLSRLISTQLTSGPTRFQLNLSKRRLISTTQLLNKCKKSTRCLPK